MHFYSSSKDNENENDHNKFKIIIIHFMRKASSFFQNQEIEEFKDFIHYKILRSKLENLSQNEHEILTRLKRSCYKLVRLHS